MHPRGMSVVDVSWANSVAARLVTGWRVSWWSETLSDHRYIFIDFGTSRTGRLRRQALRDAFSRWNFGRLDPDLFVAAILVREWASSEEQSTPED